MRNAFEQNSISQDRWLNLEKPKVSPTVLDASGHPIIVQNTAQVYSRIGGPNCILVGVANGIRGAMVGAAFGVVMGASTAVQSGYRGSSALTYAGQNGLRNAASFASWTALYGVSRCGLFRLRRRDDILNAGLAGAFTGAVLTLAVLRGHWRYNQNILMTNTAGSALIAVTFNALGSL